MRSVAAAHGSDLDLRDVLGADDEWDGTAAHFPVVELETRRVIAFVDVDAVSGRSQFHGELSRGFEHGRFLPLEQAGYDDGFVRPSGGGPHQALFAAMPPEP